MGSMPAINVGREARTTTVVTHRVQHLYRPDVSPLPAVLHANLAARAMVASRDATVVASLEPMGDDLVVRHSDATCRLPEERFEEAMLVRAYPLRFSTRGVRLWGTHADTGRTGIWHLSPDGLAFVAPLSRLTGFMTGPNGEIPLGPAGRGTVAAIIGDNRMTFPEGTQLSFDPYGNPRTLIPLEGRLSGRWLMTDSADVPVRTEVAGRPLWPLGFLADHAESFSWRGADRFRLRSEGRERVWENGREGDVSETGGGIENLWSSSDGSAIAALVRVADRPGIRRLQVGDERAYQGPCFMGPDDFQWSEDGSQYVARLVRRDDDGTQAEEIVVTRSRQIVVAARNSVTEIGVSDDGAAAYVVSDVTGYRMVLEGATVARYPYIWNLRVGVDGVSANVLHRGQICRVQIPHFR